jgi:hypothetical protein
LEEEEMLAAFRNATIGAATLPPRWRWAGMLVLAAAGLGLSGVIARADVTTFDVSGTMTPTLNAACSPTCMLGGDFLFDDSAGAPHHGISADVTVTGFSPSTGPFTGFAGIGAVSGLTELTLDDASGDFVQLVFSTPTAGSLVGYTGGPLVATSTFVKTAGLPPSSWALTSGSLAEPVPEPPSLLLLFSALMGLGALLGKRRLPRRSDGRCGDNALHGTQA